MSVLIGAQFVDWLAEHVYHAAEHATAYRDRDRAAEVDGLHSANQTLRGLHRHAAHAALAQMAGDFGDDVQRLRIVETFAGDVHRVVNERQMPFFELHVDHRSDDFDHPSGFQITRCHDCS